MKAKLQYPVFVVYFDMEGQIFVTTKEHEKTFIEKALKEWNFAPAEDKEDGVFRDFERKEVNNKDFCVEINASIHFWDIS